MTHLNHAIKERGIPVIKRQFTQVVLCLGLALGSATVANPAQGPAASAHASGIDLGALMTKAIANAHSFKVVSDSTSTHAATSPGGVTKMHIEEIFVRRGAGFAMSMQVTLDGKYSAEVYTGSHVCLKRTASAAWNCAIPAAYIKSMAANIDPAKAFKASGVIMKSVAPAGTKRVEGQLCTGYQYALSVPSLHLVGHGTIWFSTASARVVQVDDLSTTSLIAGAAPMVTTSTGTFSRWDDASLRIPAVPAS